MRFAGKNDMEGFLFSCCLLFLTFFSPLFHCLFVSLLSAELGRAVGLAEGVSERVLLQEIMFAFQGIEGKVISRLSTDDGFRLSNEVQARARLLNDLVQREREREREVL